MQAHPVKRYREPAYPTRLEVLSQPQLLRQHVPNSWRALPEMAGAVALFLAANTTILAADKSTNAASAVVAPIFNHGEGRGSLGCVVVAAPVFLSEEEAWLVIDEELAKKGLHLKDKKHPISGVSFTQRIEGWDEKKQIKVINELPNSSTNYVADRAVSNGKLALEFVSFTDYSRLGGVRSLSTASEFDLKALGGQVGKAVKDNAKEKVCFGVFYDPMTIAKLDFNSGKSYEKITTQAKAESCRLLRLQVRDFMKWLEGQGVI